MHERLSSRLRLKIMMELNIDSLTIAQEVVLPSRGLIRRMNEIVVTLFKMHYNKTSPLNWRNFAAQLYFQVLTNSIREQLASL